MSQNITEKIRIIKYKDRFIVFNLQNMQGSVVDGEELKAVCENLGNVKTDTLSPYLEEVISRLAGPARIDNSSDFFGDCHYISPVIAVTHNCNYHCTYCYEKSYQKNQTIAPEQIGNIDEFYKIYTSHYGMEKNYGSVSIIGGEPLLPANREVLETIHNVWNDIPVRYTTNGTYIRHFGDILGNIRKLKLVVSLDGTKEMHLAKRLTTDPDYYDKTIDGIKWAVEKGIDTSILSVFHPEYVDKYPMFFDLLESLGWGSKSNISLAFAPKMNSGCDDLSREYVLKTADSIKRLKRIDARINNADILKLIPGAFSLARCLEKADALSSYACGALQLSNFAFSPDGYVYFCNTTRCPEARVGRFFPDIFVDFSAIERLRKRTFENFSECRECDYKLICACGCPISSITHYKTTDKPFCSFWKDREIVDLLTDVFA